MTYTKKDWLNYLVALILAIAAYFVIPVAGGLTELGRVVVALLIFDIYCWITIDTVISSLITITAVMVMQLLPTASILQSSFGSLLVGILFAPVLVSIPLTELGIMDYVSCWFLSRKSISGRPYLYFLMIGVAAYVLGALGGVMIALFSVMPLVVAICQQLGVKKGDRFYTASFLMVLWTVFTAEAYFPFAKSIYITGTSIFSAFGFSDDLGAYMRWSVPLVIVNLLVALLIIKLVVRPDTTCFDKYDREILLVRMKQVKFGSKAVVALVLFALFVLCIVLPIFKDSSALCAYLNKCTMLPFGFVVTLCYFLIPFGEEHKPMLDFKKTMSEYPWGLALFLSCTMLLTSLMTNPDFGVTTAAASLLSPLTGKMGAAGVTILAVVLVFVMTNVMSNTVALAIVLPTFLPIIMEMNDSVITPLAFFMAVDFTAVCGFIFRPAQPPTPLVIGPHISQKDNLLPSIIMGIVLMAEMVGLILLGIA